MFKRRSCAAMRTRPKEKSLPKEIAFKLHNKIPVIYSVEPYLKSVAFRWRTQLNEKTPSHWPSIMFCRR